MKHLFLINPIAAKVKGRVRELTDEIEAFFRDTGMENFHIHVTRWARDGMGYANRFAQKSPEPVRIHAMGGSGMLFEAINGTAGLPNVQIAAYPMGGNNFFIHYFGADKEHLFASIANQVYSDVTPIDLMCNKNIYGVGYITIGLEAVIDRYTSDIMARSNLPYNLSCILAVFRAIGRSNAITQHYEIDIDGKDYSGEYATMLIAGGPCYGSNMTPAPEAHPNDGLMDIYLMKKISKIKMLQSVQTYAAGGHEKLNGLVLHERGKKISVLAQSDIIMSMDNEKFYERGVSYEIIPAAIDFVCPGGIDVSQLPLIYKKA
ncbi:MAG: hypothetical protein FWH17_01800 [Oscillospiraceae bacterium]|nr:hypothetical protein [Oscillospiraceae bacterium]